MSIRLFEAFSGYGGASFGLKRAGIDFEVIGHSEIDRNAIALYDLNFPGVKNYGDITKIDVKTIPDFDLICGGFPCQPFSIAGNNKGELDFRGNLFYDMFKIIEYKRPKYILLENVKGLTYKNHYKTFNKILESLNKAQYKVFYKVLNTADYGIPQNRERLWIFATLDYNLDGSILELPKIKLNKRIKDFLDDVPDSSLYLEEKRINRLIDLYSFDFNVGEPLCVDIYSNVIKYNGICPTLTNPSHCSLRLAEPISDNKFKVRKLSINELYRLMGFNDGEINFGDITYGHLGRFAGNGWDINIVSKIFEKMFKK